MTKGPSFTGNYYGYLYETDPRLPRLREALEAAAIRWSERREHIYTTSELRSGPLLWLIVRRAPRDTGGPVDRSQYDFSNACPDCGTSAVQIAPLLVKRSGLSKRAPICETTDGEILAGPKLMQRLRTEHVSGIDLRRVLSRKDQTPLDWWQIISNHELPPMDPATRGLVRGDPAPCPRCNRDGHFHSAHEPVEIVYTSRIDPASLPDVVHTWECFGKSRSAKPGEPFEYSHFAAPLLLVKPKVFDVFKEQKVRGVEFVPVETR